MIKCTKCKKEKHEDEFRVDLKKKNKKRSSCRKCDLKADKRTPEQLKEKTQKWRDKNKDILPYSYRRWSLKTYYGLVEEDYNKMLEKQNGCCAICFSKPSTKNLAVDHCHTSGKIRGLLCANCNTALGLLKDDITIIEKAIKYLTKHLQE